jgi:hypothetical protein
MLGDMWRDLSNEREKWGCKSTFMNCTQVITNSSRSEVICPVIGKTSALLATDAENSSTVAWLSYWKSLDDLHRFARHFKGWNWYVKRYSAYIGLVHETYVVPAGDWETIYYSFKPFGLGQFKNHASWICEKR